MKGVLLVGALLFLGMTYFTATVLLAALHPAASSESGSFAAQSLPTTKRGVDSQQGAVQSRLRPVPVTGDLIGHSRADDVYATTQQHTVPRALQARARQAEPGPPRLFPLAQLMTDWSPSNTPCFAMYPRPL